jgi:RNA polymerase sigma-70 factor (ECF subfamily)
MTCSEAVEFPAALRQTPVKARADNKSGEGDLVRRLQAHDELAFHEMVERYQSKVFSIIYGILRNRNDAEDIAQQVFTKIYFSIGRFDSRSSLLTWVHRITVNECYDYLRKRRVRKLVYESDFSAEDAECMEATESVSDFGAPLENQLAERDLVVKLLSNISEEARSLILLREVEGHSVEELAAMTGLNENTVKIKLFRTRKKLLTAARRLGNRQNLKSSLGASQENVRPPRQKMLWLDNLLGARS